MICRRVALDAEGKAVVRSGGSADMAVDRMSATATGVILSSGADPVVQSSCKTGAYRRIAMAGITFAPFERAIDMQGFIDKDVGVAVPGRINIAVAVAGGADWRSCRKTCRQDNSRMAGGSRRREAVTGSAAGHTESWRQICGVVPDRYPTVPVMTDSGAGTAFPTSNDRQNARTTQHRPAAERRAKPTTRNAPVATPQAATRSAARGVAHIQLPAGSLPPTHGPSSFW